MFTCLSIIAVIISCLLIKCNGNDTTDVYATISQLFKRGKHSKIQVQSALRKIASNQATVKSMDGILILFTYYS